MSVEALTQLQHEVYPYIRDIFQHYPIVPVAFIGWLWRLLKQERSQASGVPIEDLEIDHIKPNWRGGTDNRSNLQALTRPEHAEKHFKEAKNATDRKTARNEYGAVSMIVQRMKPDELKEFNKRIGGGDKSDNKRS